MICRASSVACLIAFLSICISIPSFAAEPKTTATDVYRKADETAHAVKNYTVQQRDDAIRSAKTALDDLDARIDGLERKLDRNWDKMDAASRKKARATLDALRKQRDEAAEWYGGLKHGSAEAWDEVKNGFVRSYETLRDSFAKARKQF
jgi:predicted RNase H-like nuclease (RuvC/YqgF family)